MAIGDDGVLGGMPLVPGSIPANTIDTKLNLLQDYLANGFNYWKPGVVLPIARGGLGSTTVSGARTALGLPAAGAAEAATPGTLAQRYADGTIDAVQFATASDPTLPNHCTRRAWVESYVSSAIGSGYLPLTGGTLSGQLYLPASSPASSGWTSAYIDGTGRVCRGASSMRYKDDITPIDPLELGDLFPQLHTFVMKDDPGRMQRVGYIAEHLNESAAQRPFVVHQREAVYEDVLTDIIDEEGVVVGQRVVDRRVVGSRRARDEDGEPIPDSIESISLLLAQVAQLHARVAALEAAR